MASGRRSKGAIERAAAEAPAAGSVPMLTAEDLEQHRVRLEAFDGPLDLLLFLIRKSEVDVHDIPIARITEQYLAVLRASAGMGAGMGAGLGGGTGPEAGGVGARPVAIDIDQAGEFLVLAATLMEIKSRMLMPKEEGAEEASAGVAKPTEDPRAELVRQLLEYKRYRDAAEALERRGEAWRRRYPTRPALPESGVLREALSAAQDLDLEDLELVDLLEAFRKVAETVNFDRLGEHSVQDEDLPLEAHAQSITRHLASRPTLAGEVEFAELFRGKSRREMIGTFLALLELIRRREVAFRVDGGAREGSAATIMVRLRPEEERAEGAEAAEAGGSAAEGA